MNNNAGDTGLGGYWYNGQWYPFQSTWTYTYPDPTQVKVIEQLLKRIADLEARLDTKENNGTNRS
jgi:hypothetical protein